MSSAPSINDQRLAVGFAGLGRMGAPMASRLVRAAFDVTVFNRTPERCEPLRQAGARVANTPRALAEGRDVLVTMLADPEAARAVIADPEEGLLAGSHPGQVLVDMSTIGPQNARDLAAAAATCGVGFLDAPVSGSTPAARAGTLMAMVGGDQSALEVADPVLRELTDRRIWLGPAGSGATMKLVVNGVLAVLNESLAEGLVLAEAAGIERATAYDVLASSAVAAPYLGYKREAFLGGSVDVAFTLAGLRKDVGLVLNTGREMGVPMPTTSVTFEMLAAACGLGHANADIADATVVLRRLAGIQ